MQDPVIIKLVLLGEPMAKQSARFAVKKDKWGRMVLRRKNGRICKDRVGHPIPMLTSYQTSEHKAREADYIFQIKRQLPKGFKTFEGAVEVLEYKVIYKPLKKHTSSKKTMTLLSSGKFIPKTTRPDLPDNLKKLAFDAMEKAGVYKNDGQVWKESNTQKVYGLFPRIEIIIKGYELKTS